MPRNSRSLADVTAYNKSHYGDTLCEFRRRKGLTQQQLAQALGISKNIVTHWEAGRVRPDINLLPALCDALGITLAEFFRLPLREGALSVRETQLLSAYRALSSRDKLVLESALSKLTELNQSALWERCREEFIPIFRNSQTAAAGISAQLEEASGEQVFVRKNRLSRRAREIITVNGDSMRPRYLHGQDVYVEAADDIRIGDIGIFVVNGSGYIKERRMDCLHSLNPNYPDIRLQESDDIRCYGRVLGPVAAEDYPTPEEQAVLEELGREQEP